MYVGETCLITSLYNLLTCDRFYSRSISIPSIIHTFVDRLANKYKAVRSYLRYRFALTRVTIQFKRTSRYYRCRMRIVNDSLNVSLRNPSIEKYNPRELSRAYRIVAPWSRRRWKRSVNTRNKIREIHCWYSLVIVRAYCCRLRQYFLIAVSFVTFFSFPFRIQYLPRSIDRFVSISRPLLER